jgi:3-dehydroquinate synthase
MRTIEVNLGGRSYPVHVGAGLLEGIGQMIRDRLGRDPRCAILISNPTIDALYGAALRRSLRRAGFRALTFLIGDGERFKSLATAMSLYTFMIERGIERSDLIVALGGGVVGDLAGFVAATYLRGISFVQVPTTLVAQIDSSVGGKGGVNHRLGKNLIGAFHQPSLVIADVNALRTLPRRQMRAGMYEALKYGIIRDRSLFEWIGANLDRIWRFDQGSLAQLVGRCLEIKAEIVSLDEREAGLRRILNFGHTVGHALEAVTNYRRFHHGEAVGHGMRAASRIAERMGLLDRASLAARDEAVARIGPLPRTSDLAIGDIILAMRRDKKSQAGRIAFVLPVEIGRVVLRTDVPQRVIRLALKEALSK